MANRIKMLCCWLQVLSSFYHPMLLPGAAPPMLGAALAASCPFLTPSGLPVQQDPRLDACGHAGLSPPGSVPEPGHGQAGKKGRRGSWKSGPGEVLAERG